MGRREVGISDILVQINGQEQFLFLSQKKQGQHECVGRLDPADAEEGEPRRKGPYGQVTSLHFIQAGCLGDILNNAEH